MDQFKIRIAMLMVAGIIVWIAGAYALDGWRSYRLRAEEKRRAGARPTISVVPHDDRPQLPPAEAA
ncbi:MAG: hypothetical protein KJ000_32580 [Pirellulaceae bacterium]|jgi:hypothetical protein|nr:hypothetical protein [Pirellulaceae bacterium]